MSINGVAFYEALKGLRGLFSSSGADISISQQTASAILPSRDDEAIQLALDATLNELENHGPAHLARVQRVRVALKPHQRTDWRVNLGSLKMTERFEQVMISETTTRNHPGEQGDQPDPALQQRRRNGGRHGQERIERKFDRRQRDIEWTLEDPRVRHLILVSRIVEQGDRQQVNGIPQGVPDAISYLFSAGLIKEKSATEIGSEVASAALEGVSKNAFRGVASLQLGDAYDVIMAHPAPGVDQDQVIGRALDQKLRTKKANHAAHKAAGLPGWFWIIIICGGILTVSGIVALRFL